MIITIDGPSGTGKSTLAKILANKLNIKFLNTGMIYRALTYYFIINNIDPDNVKLIKNELSRLIVEIDFIDGSQHILINGSDYTNYISNREVNDSVALFSQILIVRKKVLELQRDFASKNDIVIEGRDIGTEVFPKAEFKFYVDCDIIVRAKRRFEDLKENDNTIKLEDIIASLKNRDYIDKTRRYSPLTKPKGAIDIDTSNMTIDETINKMLSIIQ